MEQTDQLVLQLSASLPTGDSPRHALASLQRWSPVPPVSPLANLRADEAMTIAEANSLLRSGCYGVSVDHEAGRCRLLGEGAGRGIPLDRPLTRLGLARALIRLRRTRRRHDVAWVQNLSRLLESGSHLRSWTEGNRRLFDLLGPRYIRRPPVPPGPRPSREIFWLPCVALPVDRVSVLLPDGELPPLLVEEVSRVLEFLSSSDGTIAMPITHEQADRTPLPAPDLALLAEPTWSEHRLVVGRPREDGSAAWQIELETGSRETVERQVRQWSDFASTVATDPVLRMHCATQPALLAVADPTTGLAAVAHLAEPYPHHPNYPGGTIAASLSTLLFTSDETEVPLLQRIVENRFERREDELEYFIEHFVRPLIKVFRICLDRHQIGLFRLHEKNILFELSPELESTGRIVIKDFGQLRRRAALDVRSARAGMFGLYDVLGALAVTFQRSVFHDRRYPAGKVRSAVDKAVTEEMRFLSPETAELLNSDHPMRRFVHSISPQQDRVLKSILRSVEERAQKRRSNRTLPIPTVVLDVDMCALVPLKRTLLAVQKVAGPRPGAPNGIPELLRPTHLRLLPAPTSAAWQNFVDQNRLSQRYPDVDWPGLRSEFGSALAEPPENLRSDSLNPGLSRFLWDVYDAGGEVIFYTERPERLRDHTEHVLAQYGVSRPRLLTTADDHGGAVGQWKTENLRALTDVDIVAVFDAVAAHRTELGRHFPEATVVAVEVPRFATERGAADELPPHTPVIATFETLPRAIQGSPAAVLSHTHSLEELQIRELSTHRLARKQAVQLSIEESTAIIDQLVDRADAAAEQTARNAHMRLRNELASTANEQDRATLLVHHLLTRKQFNRGSRSHYSLEMATRDVRAFVARRAPIQVVMMGFPIKQSHSGLKALGLLPDLAELGSLVRLRELQRTVQQVYPPGLRITVLTDGRHFRPRPVSATGAYQRKLHEYLDLISAQGFLELSDIDTLAERWLGGRIREQRLSRIRNYQAAFHEAFDGLDITRDPLGTLSRTGPLDPMRAVAGHHDSSWLPPYVFRDIFMSIVYSIPMSVPAGRDRSSWSKALYSDVYNVTDPTLPPEVTEGRKALLCTAWTCTIRYISAAQVDQDLRYEEFFPSRVRLALAAPRRGCCGFSGLGGSGLLPWHGTGAVDNQGHVSTDFAISLADQGFVPVHSPLLGPNQPWMMVPATATRVRDRQRGAELNPSFTATIRLRRK